MDARTGLIIQRLYFTLLLVLVWALSGCSSTSKNLIRPVDLAARLNTASPPSIVDVRSTDEFNSGHIPGAIHIPYWSVFTRYDQIPTPPDQLVILYCEHGPRAAVARFFLKIVGFEKVLYLEGHMTAWKKQNLPMHKIPET